MSRFTASGTLARIDLGAGATFDKVATSEINAQQTKVLYSRTRSCSARANPRKQKAQRIDGRER